MVLMIDIFFHPSLMTQLVKNIYRYCCRGAIVESLQAFLGNEFHKAETLTMCNKAG